MTEKPKNLKNPLKMASENQLFQYLLDKSDKQEKEAAVTYSKLCELQQEVRDLKEQLQFERETRKENKTDWRWIIGLTASVALSLLSFAWNMWPK